jgi:hypothetical protein
LRPDRAGLFLLAVFRFKSQQTRVHVLEQHFVGPLAQHALVEGLQEVFPLCEEQLPPGALEFFSLKLFAIDPQRIEFFFIPRVQGASSP